MKFFLDTADLAEIEEAASWGALAGVTTNPTLYARTGGKVSDFQNHIKRICDIVDGPVSAESVAMTREEIVRDGRQLAALAPNVVVKVPTMIEGLAATRTLADEGIAVNMTLCFTVPQAILAADFEPPSPPSWIPFVVFPFPSPEIGAPTVLLIALPVYLFLPLNLFGL